MLRSILLALDDTDGGIAARDYALAFLSDVDWREIAERLIVDEEESEV
jgi:hypothetical protein